MSSGRRSRAMDIFRRRAAFSIWGEGGWVGWEEEKEAVGMSYCGFGMGGWVGGWGGRGGGSGWNEVLWVWGGWVG